MRTILEQAIKPSRSALDIQSTAGEAISSHRGIIVNVSRDVGAVDSLENHMTIDPTIIPSLIKTSAFKSLLQCSRRLNKYTNHIRLPDILYNISMSPRSSLANKTFWNPTIIALPPWAKNQYLIISMVHLENATYRQSVMCEANICQRTISGSVQSHHRHCTSDDVQQLGINGGLRCATEPSIVKVPTTSAEKCEGKYTVHGRISGFHDPRLFYTGRGETLLMLSSQYISPLPIIHPHLTSSDLNMPASDSGSQTYALSIHPSKKSSHPPPDISVPAR